MSNDKLNTAVLGLNKQGQILLEAAAQTNYFQIQAVADKDTKLAEKLSLKYNCAAYDDYRRLIMQNPFDCLLVADAIHNCDEYIKIAMKKKTNILKLAPPARNFQEAAEFVRLADDENVQFTIANPKRFSQSYLALKQSLQQGQIKQIFLITAMCIISNDDTGTWQTDPKLAGGGVLLHYCYQIIDQIVCNLPFPQQIYCINTNTASDRQQRSYLTEDTAVVTMKFSDTSFLGNLVASKAFGPAQEIIKVYGKDKILTVDGSKFTISDSLGRIIKESEYEDDELAQYTALLENFALSMLLPDKNKLCSSARENLSNMAIIEAAYLSARTAMPEEPARILQMVPTEPIDTSARKL